MKREMEATSKNQRKLVDWKNTILKMKNYWLDGLNNRLDAAEEKIK